jgi:hypothetical protein
MIRVQGYVQDYDVVRLNGDLSRWKCHYSTWRLLPLTWISNPLRFKDQVLTSSQILYQQLVIYQIATFSKLCFLP